MTFLGRALAIGLGSAWLIPIASHACYAAARDPAAADALFQQGRAEAAAGHHALACARFEESFRLDPTPGTLLNLADCSEHIGRIGVALAHFSEALKRLPTGDDRVGYVQDRIARLKKRVPRLTILAPADATLAITRDQVEVGPGARNLPLAVEPGRHLIVVRAPGHKENQITVDLAEGAEQHVRAVPGEPIPTVSTSRSSQTASPPHGRESISDSETSPADSPRGHAALPWAIAGVGAAGMVVGATAGFLALDKAAEIRDRCGPARQCADEAGYIAARDASDSGKALATASTVGLSVGVASLVTAAYLWLRPPREEHARTRLWVTTSSIPSGAGVTAIVDF